ncbi:MAG: hypothetical protein E7269_01545 [Lachnospiraceae bacterium]|nr:hypothetical protein [Lachnospiraceae bacterium]
MLLIACVILIFGVVLFRSISGSKEQLATLQATEQELSEQLAEQEERSAALEEQRVYVKTKAYVEEAAKKIGLIYPNEVIFKPAE